MFDVLIRNGRVIDGSGNPWCRADVGISHGRIEAIGHLPAAEAQQTIDATGFVVCPGFVDVHAHSELALLSGEGADAGILQGVTTQVIAADGLSYAPLPHARLLEMRTFLAGIYGAPDIGWDFSTVAEYLAKFPGRLPNNIIFQAPHAAIRLNVMGWSERPAQPDEIRSMQRLIETAIDEGAGAFATILDTAPCAWADTHELIELCRVVAARGGILATHIRYPIGMQPAIEEVLSVAEAAGIPLHISHHYTEPGIFAPLERARARGVDVTFDAYPYWAGSTTMLPWFPLWVRTGSPEEFKARLADGAIRRRLKAEGLSVDAELIRGTQLGAVPPASNAWMEGRRIGEVVDGLGADLIDWICDVLLEADLGINLVEHGIATEELMLAAITHPLHMGCTDGIVIGSHPHPRAFNAYPRLLGRYVRDKGVLTWENAIRKCSGFPAQRYGLSDRGLLKRGLAGDVLVFDPATIIDRGTYENPRVAPAGIEYVLVNGQVAVERGRRTATYPGAVLRALA